MVPQSFNDWKNCIVNDCKINLIQEFATESLAVYQDNKNGKTQKFISLYGQQHLSNIIKWLQQI